MLAAPARVPAQKAAPMPRRRFPTATSLFEVPSANMTGSNPRVDNAWLWPAVSAAPMNFGVTAHNPQQRTANKDQRNQRGILESSAFQVPSSKEAPRLNLQVSGHQRCSGAVVFGAWCLECGAFHQCSLERSCM